MNIIKSKPITSGQRHQINLSKNLLCKYNKIIKNLNHTTKKSGGRGLFGSITVRHIGGGCKTSHHLISNFKSYQAIVLFTMYNSKKNSFISLNFDLNSNFFFKTYSTNNIFPGSLILKQKSKIKELKLGYTTLLSYIPVGSIIHSIFIKNKFKYALSAGTFCQLIEKKKFYSKIKLPSGTIITVPTNTTEATIGVVSNFKYKQIYLGKAGRNRLLGIRPTVRGIAMNPVDHPHGGRSNGGKIPVTPWGIATKGKKTKKI